MFQSIINLVLLLLLIGFAVDTEPLINAPFIGLIIYGLVLGVIFLQNRYSKDLSKRHNLRFLALTNWELISFFCIFYFVLGGQSLFFGSFIALTLASIFMYFLGLWIHHLSSFYAQNHGVREEYKSPMPYATGQIKFLIPFVIPFIFFSFLSEIITDSPFSIGFLGVFFILASIFFPVVLQHFWEFQPIEDKELRNRLEKLCRRLHFKHSGMKTWSILKHAITAGIIGIVPRYRYVMFTDRILKELPPESLEAVLAHEICHSKKKHLVLYPFILFGMVVTAGYVFFLLGDLISNPFVAYLLYILVAILYFRIVFGYFSRLFERQADLYVFAAEIPHEHMLKALDYIGTATGNSHKQPNWHHFSIQERMDFLNLAAANPSLIVKHNKWVKISLWIYFMVLIPAAIFILFF